MSVEGSFLLGEWQAWPLENRLSKDPHTIIIEPKAMDVLVYLAQYAGDVVSSDQLVSACWPGQFIGDSPIYKIIAQLRKALGDDSRQPNYILTIPKRGYQLIESVTWLSQKKSKLSTPIANWHGASPYRGLQFFDQQHSDVFFGRSRAKSEMIQSIRRAVENDCGFVLLLGKSGSGKSSLIRAGVIPLLTQPGGFDDVVVSGAAILTPLEQTDQQYIQVLFQLLVEHHILLDANDAELLLNAHNSVEACQQFVQSNTPSNKPLLLVIDQIEIIFNQQQTPVQFIDFITCIDALVRSGYILVIAVLRNDYYQAFMEFSLLEALKNSGQQYDLSMPTPAEMAQMIKRPALVAGLTFAQDSLSEEKLDDILLVNASENPDVLPLLQYSLFELYQNRDSNGEMQLSTYRQMGGLTGALSIQAERVYAQLSESAQAQLPKLLHFLIRIGSDSNAPVTRQPMRLDKAWNNDCRQLINAFVKARLFIIEWQGENNQLLITHDALIKHWPRIKRWQEQNQQALKTRARLAEACMRWENENRSRDLLLPTGIPLQEASALIGLEDIDLSATERSLITASQRQARGFNYFKRAIFSACLVLSITAGLAAYNANAARKAAQHSREQADNLINFMLGDLRDRLQQVGRLDILDRVGDQVTTYVANIQNDSLTIDSRLQHIQALKLVGEVRLAEAKNDDALASFIAAYNQAKVLQNQSDQQENLLAVSSELSYWVGYMYYLRGDLEQTKTFWNQYHRGALGLLEINPDHANWWLELSYALNNLGTLASAQGDINAAIKLFKESIHWKRKVLSKQQGDENIMLELADSYSWLGSAYRSLGSLTESLNQFQAELDILNSNHFNDPTNYFWHGRKFLALQQLGILYLEQGSIDQSISTLNDAKSIINLLLEHDNERLDWHWDNANLMFYIGKSYKAKDNFYLANDAFNQAINEISLLTSRDGKAVEWRRLHAAILIELARIDRHQKHQGLAEEKLNNAIDDLELLQHQNIKEQYVIISLAEAYTELGKVLVENGNIEHAKRYWELAHSLLSPLVNEKSPDTRQLHAWVSVLTLLEQWGEILEPWKKLKSTGYRNTDFVQLDKLISDKLEQL